MCNQMEIFLYPVRAKGGGLSSLDQKFRGAIAHMAPWFRCPCHPFPPSQWVEGIVYAYYYTTGRDLPKKVTWLCYSPRKFSQYIGALCSKC